MTVAEIMSTWAARPGRAVIFDFNGTLSDDEPILEAIFVELFTEHLGWAMTGEEYRNNLLGHSDREIVEIAVRAHGDDPRVIEKLMGLRRARYKEIVAAHSPITAHASELVERLAAARIPMAIVTGAQREDVEAVLGASLVGEFIRLMITEEDVRSGKPDPEGFLQGAELLGVDPADVLVFEDSVPGIRGALAAGMACIAITGPVASGAVVKEAPAVVTRLDVGLLAGTGL